MATLDDILSTDPQRGRSRLNPSGNPNAPESGGEEITPPVKQPPKSNDAESKPPVVTTPQATSSTETKKGGYLELLQALDPYKPPTAEELENAKNSLQHLEMALLLSPISILRHRAHRICMTAKTRCRKPRGCDMISC